MPYFFKMWKLGSLCHYYIYSMSFYLFYMKYVLYALISFFMWCLFYMLWFPFLRIPFHSFHCIGTQPIACIYHLFAFCPFLTRGNILAENCCVGGLLFSEMAWKGKYGFGRFVSPDLYFQELLEWCVKWASEYMCVFERISETCVACIVACSVY